MQRIPPDAARDPTAARDVVEHDWERATDVHQAKRKRVKNKITTKGRNAEK